MDSIGNAVYKFSMWNEMIGKRNKINIIKTFFSGQMIGVWNVFNCSTIIIQKERICRIMGRGVAFGEQQGFPYMELVQAQ